VKYAEGLKEEDERHIKEGLTEDELELYDILKKDKMTKAEEIKVKNAAKNLLRRLIEERPRVLVQDWFKDGQSRQRVQATIEEILDKELPESYGREVFKQKSGRIFDLIYNHASNRLKTIYCSSN
jgi:type I restriction enzyme R subunit